MNFKVLATDYDGTLAHHGRVDPATVEALERFRHSGRQLVLVTGREILDLQSVFDRLDLFDLIVAENGAVLFRPSTGRIKLLAEPPPPLFTAELRARGVARISVGHVIVATWEPYEVTVLKLIRDLGLELQVIFNKGAVMILPTGVNKGSGLVVALREIGIEPREAVGVGDAENDHALFHACGCGVAVANAIPMLKESADFVTQNPSNAGVRELIDIIIETDLAGIQRAEKV